MLGYQYYQEIRKLNMYDEIRPMNEAISELIKLQGTNKQHHGSHKIQINEFLV